LSSCFLTGMIELVALGWPSVGWRCSRWVILPTRIREFSRNRGRWRRHVLPIVSRERESRFLSCGERNPELVFVSGATFGVGLDRQSKGLGVEIVPLAFTAVVAGDCGNRGINLLVVELFVLAVLIAISLVFIRDRAREVELARRRAIEPANGRRRGGPDDVATAEVVPEGKAKDEQEETEDYVWIAKSDLLGSRARAQAGCTHEEKG
jgi:hypothetical protein